MNTGYKLGSSIYCIAPIVHKDQGAFPAGSAGAEEIHYFAVGRECCDHQNRFQCGMMAKAEKTDLQLGGYLILVRGDGQGRDNQPISSLEARYF